MLKTIFAASVAALLFSGAAWAGCPSDMRGQDVNLSGTVSHLANNPQLSHWAGDWSLRVDVPQGPCKGLVIIKSEELPSCHPGQSVFVSGKVVSATLFGNRTDVEPESKILCSYEPAKKTTAIVSSTGVIDAAR